MSICCISQIDVEENIEKEVSTKRPAIYYRELKSPFWKMDNEDKNDSSVSMLDKLNQAELAEQLKEMRDVDIRTVDATKLKEIDEVSIDSSLPIKDRVASFVKQIGNPYCYKSHGVVVKVSFSGNKRLEDCLTDCLSLT